MSIKRTQPFIFQSLPLLTRMSWRFHAASSAHVHVALAQTGWIPQAGRL